MQNWAHNNIAKLWIRIIVIRRWRKAVSEVWGSKSIKKPIKGSVNKRITGDK